MRCASIDFHTSPLIPEIGTRFDKQKFAKTYQEAHIEQVLIFAKCHHGYTYYPTKVGTMHPNLNFDLLGAELDALRSVGIKAPIQQAMRIRRIPSRIAPGHLSASQIPNISTILKQLPVRSASTTTYPMASSTTSAS